MSLSTVPITVLNSNSVLTVDGDIKIYMSKSSKKPYPCVPKSVDQHYKICWFLQDGILTLLNLLGRFPYILEGPLAFCCCC